MRKLLPRSRPFYCAALLIFTLTGCSPEAKKARYQELADRNFDKGKYEAAEIDYKNVLKIDSLNPHAIARLGMLYAEQGRITQAIPFLVKGRELEPENLALRLKYGSLSLAMGSPKDALAEANFILDRRPQDPEAPLLLVATVAKPQDIATVRTRLESLPPPAPSGAPVLTALAQLEQRQGHTKEAEALLNQALAVDPQYAAAHTSLGYLYGIQKNKPLAEQSFKKAADASPARSPRHLQYAQYKIQTGDVTAGKQYLSELTRATPDFLAAWTLLAELALTDKQFPECAAYIENIISRDTGHLEARVLRGRLLMAQGTPAKAIEEFERLAQNFPRAPLVHYNLGLAYLAVGEPAKAAVSLKQALTLSPNLAEAALALANLSLRTGEPGAAELLLKPLVRQHPENLQLHLLLAEAFRAQKKLAEALALYRQLESHFPGNAQVSLMTGLILLQQNQLEQARQSFTLSLERAPGLLPALDYLVALDLREKQFETAYQRVETELVKNPKLAGARVLLARIALQQADTARAEAELSKAIELQPDNTEACRLLAQLQINAGRGEKAIANLNAIVNQNPKDVGAWMLIGMLQEQQKNHTAARDAYDKILTLNPRHFNALNNLAYLYSEHLNEPDKAYAAAQKAREIQPGEPHTADTLGWIIFKKGHYRWALSLLEESATKLPDEPTVHYHLGLTRYMLGLEAPARLALQNALDQNKAFAESTDAKNRLALLAIDGREANADALALLKNTLAKQPGDPVALARLAAQQEQTGAIDKAIATQLLSAQSNPGLITPSLNLARLYALRKEPAKALEAAKTARKIALDDPDACRLLGRIAFESGDFKWAASLLQDAARKITDDPGLLYETAEALFSIGRVSEAETFAQEALDQARASATRGELLKPFAQAEQTRQFLELIALGSKPDPSAIDRIELLLKSAPDSVPALIALAAAQERGANAAAARVTYGKALAHYPDFTPAKLRLAILGVALSEFDEKAYDYAQQARAVFPSDPELTRALGILTYRKGGEANRAVALLKPLATARPNDTVLLYYLGRAQLEIKDRTNGRQALKKALDAGLPPALTSEAQAALKSSR